MPRGLGGSSDPTSNAASNLLLVCGTGNEDQSTCHGLIESQRAMSYANGWLIHQATTNPTQVPVLIAGGAWVQLNDQGGYDLLEEHP